MQKIEISYEEYDKLCKISSTIECKLLRLPTREEIDLLTSSQIGYFLSVLTWLIESGSGIPDTPDAREIREYTIDRLDDGMAEYMYLSKQSEMTSGKMKIDISDYRQILNIAKTVDFIDTGELLADEQINTQFLPMAKYCFGFLMIFLVKNRPKRGLSRYKHLRKVMDDHYVLQDNHKLFNMTEKQYSDLCEAILKCPVRRDGWWPTMQETVGIIIPNIENCYDFILWILKTGPKPENPEENKVYKLLRAVIRENTNITEEGEVSWL